jgi:aspartyl protease family protein
MFNDFVKLISSIAVLAIIVAGVVQKPSLWPGGPAMHAQAASPAAAPARFTDNSVATSTPAVAPARSGWGVVELSPDRNAQYRAEIEINGVRINALVDTGASHVALTAQDARALNIDPPGSAYILASQTANGVAHSAPARLGEVRVGSIVIHDVEALVAQPGALSTSLLGMSFLKKLGSFQVADGRFVMKQ